MIIITATNTYEKRVNTFGLVESHVLKNNTKVPIKILSLTKNMNL